MAQTVGVPGHEPVDRASRGPRLAIVRALFWAVCGSIVVLYLFFVALDALDPADNRTAAIAVLVLAVLWLAHAWRRLWSGLSGDPAARERRGF